MPKTSNYRLAKIHQNYSVEEAARLYGVHRNTVREWIKSGLPVIAGHPILILGRDLRAFLQERNQQRKRPCLPNEIYCMRCRVPRVPAADMADYQETAPNRGRIVALCPCCGTAMYRSVNPNRIPPALASMLLKKPAAPEHIGERTPTIVNSDFGLRTG